MIVWFSLFISVQPFSSPLPTRAGVPVVDPIEATTSDEDEEDDRDDDVALVDAESEAGAAIDTVGDDKPRYTADLLQAELERRFNKDIVGLGSISVGFADA